MRILFTGFDPFGGEKINPAGEAVKMMKNEIQGAEILKLEVPTVFGKAGEVLKKAVEQYRPDAVVCVGQAGGRYFSIMALCSYGLKCGISEQKIRRAAYAFLDHLESLTEDEDNHFSRADVKDGIKKPKMIYFYGILKY
ncbi:peptidase C15 [Campylobacter coli]|nr:peptidase C15 [Campylobacter coli]EAI0849536.1 peptidase C15 [Campylobacter coli]EAI4823637.1 peptidase C15 [Campylobacter coli]EAI4823656.1 peptidase C15 [Campylobacter coli]EAI5684638.1 peptidase C15 [Campylobacter coli]